MSLRKAVFVALSTLSLGALAQSRAATATVDYDSLRPEELTVGVGAGWLFPHSILEPNSVSVRVKAGAFAFEPTLTLGGGSGGSSSTTTTTVGTTTTTTDSEDTLGGLNLGIGGNVRYTFASAGPVDFVGIGGIGVGYASNTVNNDVQVENQTDRTTTNSLSANLNWGVGVEWFLSRNLVVSADVSNPLVSWNRTTRLDEFSDTSGATPVSNSNETVTTGLSYGLQLQQTTARLMFHLYF